MEKAGGEALPLELWENGWRLVDTVRVQLVSPTPAVKTS